MYCNMIRGGMMWAMGLIWLLAIILLVLSIATLVKYHFIGRKQRSNTPVPRSVNDQPYQDASIYH